jgi:hypothetical protein
MIPYELGNRQKSFLDHMVAVGQQNAVVTDNELCSPNLILDGLQRARYGSCFQLKRNDRFSPK